MAFFRRLFPRRQAQARAASAPHSLAEPGPGTAASPFAQRRYLTEVPSLLPKNPLEDQRLTYGRDESRQMRAQ